MTQDELTQTYIRLSDLGHSSAGVGHHVINAFSAIVSNAEILRLAVGSQMAVDPVAIADLIVRTAVEASAVARRLIDYTRSATTVGAAQVSLNEILAGFVEGERGGGPPRVDWVTDLGAIPPIVGHRLQLLEMMRHLAANAYEAMPRTGGTITVATALDDRGWVVLEVRDSGQGMEGGTLERAVEPFFTTKPSHFGVGLSIANGIWRRHHGTLALRSRPGEGTLIRLCVEPAGGAVKRAGGKPAQAHGPLTSPTPPADPPSPPPAS